MNIFRNLVFRLSKYGLSFHTLTSPDEFKMSLKCRSLFIRKNRLRLIASLTKKIVICFSESHYNRSDGFGSFPDVINIPIIFFISNMDGKGSCAFLNNAYLL